MREITTKDLKRLCELIIKKLEWEQVTNVQIETDLYRFIPTDKWSSFEDTEILTGSLYDDIDSLKRLLADNDRPTTYVDFDRLASVLRALSQEINPI